MKARFIVIVLVLGAMCSSAFAVCRPPVPFRPRPPIGADSVFPESEIK